MTTHSKMSEVENNETNTSFPNTNENSIYKDFMDNGKNIGSVHCTLCGSKILERNTGVYTVMEKELPEIHLQKDKPTEIVKEKLLEFFIVDNMYAFENIGFTHEVDNCKYLSCADCDGGPVGWFNISTKKSYLALARVLLKK